MKIAARICYVLQILGLVANAFGYPYGPMNYIADITMKLFFIDGVPGFAYALGQFFFLYLGWFFMHLHRKGMKKKEVIFYCPNCKEVYSNNRGSGQICLICRQKAKEIPVLSREFNKLAEDQQQLILNTAVEAPVPAAPVQEPAPAPKATSFLAPEPAVPAAPVEPVQPVVPVQPVAPVQPQVKHNALLCLRSGPMAGRIYAIPAGENLVAGRNPNRSSLPLTQYPKVSSAHCRLDGADGALWVTDLGSTNGTFVNGVRLTPNQPSPLREGDTLTLGTDECLFRVAFE